MVLFKTKGRKFSLPFFGGEKNKRKGYF